MKGKHTYRWSVEMKNLILAITLLIPVFAHADTPADEQIVWVRGEVKSILSVSEVAKISALKPYISLITKDCKAQRNNDPQCEANGTAPIIANVHLNLGRDEKSIIPVGMAVKVGDLVTTEEHPPVAAPHLVNVLDKSKCGWHTAFILLGSERVECQNDKQNGWVVGTGLLGYFPLKHLADAKK
jgi:hypothetical protein